MAFVSNIDTLDATIEESTRTNIKENKKTRGVIKIRRESVQLKVPATKPCIVAATVQAIPEKANTEIIETNV